MTHDDEQQQRDAALTALTERIARWTEGGERVETAVPGLALFRRNAPSAPHTISRRASCRRSCFWYSRFFGAPPLRDISLLREAAAG